MQRGAFSPSAMLTTLCAQDGRHFKRKTFILEVPQALSEEVLIRVPFQSWRRYFSLPIAQLCNFPQVTYKYNEEVPPKTPVLSYF